MERRYILLLIVIFLGLGFAKAQSIINPGFVRQTQPYEFNLPQFGVGLSLPKGAGFMVPVFSGKEVMLNIDKKTVYCFNLDYLDDDETNTFRFSLSDDDSGVELQITKDDDFNKIIYIERLRRSTAFIDILKSVKSGLGESVSYKVRKGTDIYDIHAFYKDGYLYAFSFKSGSRDENGFFKLINNFKEKNLNKDRLLYENRVKFGYYDKERKKLAEKPCAGYKYRKIGDKTRLSRILDIPNLNMSITLPSGWVYELNGRDLSEGEDGRLILDVDDLDLLDNSMIFAWLRGDGLTLMIRYSSKKHRSPVTFSNLGSGAKQVYSFSGDTEIFFDGIKAEACYYGTPDIQNLDSWFETEQGYYSFSVSNITVDNIDAYNKLLSSIKITDNAARNKKTKEKQKPLSSALSLKAKTPVQLDKLTIPKQSDIQLFKCNLSTIGATLWLPGTASDYKYGINTSWGEEPLRLDINSSTNIAPDFENMYVYIRGGTNYDVGCTLYLRYGSKYSMDEFIKDCIRARTTVIAWDKFDKAGVIKADDGSEWGIAFEKNNTSAWIYGQNNEYLIMMTVKAASEAELLKFCSALHKAKFGNVAPL
ncbi:hypothetical protein [Dysgonomonas sp. 216]|uniref:hypothetical protein n=1 Tax=Dysgonomonas sp. 216 TaxID=2302934 RepID=UPI0013CF81BB|nr:hypothetical protein [Dysgonomonas sp. 216]